VVSAIEYAAGTVYVGGTFTSIGGQPRNHVAAVDASTGTATAWNAHLDPGGDVRSLLAIGRTVLVGGSFSTVGGQPRANLAALDATTGAPIDWVHDTDSVVRKIAWSATGIYVGGDFQRVSGTLQPYLGVLDIP
jgi:outer membrane protein assembly factor BamB